METFLFEETGYCRKGMPRWVRRAFPSASFWAVVTTVTFRE
jgi:hypothetical protein